MKQEIRQALQLEAKLENKVFDIYFNSIDLINKGDFIKAETILKHAWDLLPEPKFHTSCTNMIITNLVRVLHKIRKYEEANMLLQNWIKDIENCGYLIYEIDAYMMSAENLLYLQDFENAKKRFQETIKYGAKKTSFRDKPTFYYEIATKKITNNEEIKKLFDTEMKNTAHNIIYK